MTSFEEGKFMSHAGWMLWAASGWKSRAGMALFVRTFKLRTYTHTHIDMYIYMKYEIWYMIYDIGYMIYDIYDIFDIYDIYDVYDMI